MKRNRIMIASTKSGSGKTTVTLALLRALKNRGLKPRPYKVGPDYLDGTYHRMAAGEDSYNLDSWIMRDDFLIPHFLQTSDRYDLAVVEGVMGLFDGYEGTSKGSSADLAKLLDIPIVLIVDCAGFSGSIAPLVYGFTHFDPEVHVAGVILNNVASENHLKYLTASVQKLGIPIVGWIFRDESLTLSHRHLGLVTAFTTALDYEKIDEISRKVLCNIDVDLLLKLSQVEWKLPHGRNLKSEKPLYSEQQCRIGVARDNAFHFYYATNLDLLRKYGAVIDFFSPLTDKRLPDRVDGLYFGGGYPESYAGELALNRNMIEQIRTFAETGGIIYAECGGLIYLGRSIGDSEVTHELCGILDIDFRMLERRKSLGYAEVLLLEDTVIGKRGSIARGHEFHYSEIVNNERKGGKHFRMVYEIRPRKGTGSRREGFTYRNVLASYVHLHFGSNEHLAEGLVRSCAYAKK